MMDDRKTAVYALFDALCIKYDVVEHPPLFSQADNEKHRVNIGAMIFKNLFLRNADKSHYYLLSLPLTKRADLVKVREILAESRLSFGEEDALLDKLNIRPGSVVSEYRWQAGHGCYFSDRQRNLSQRAVRHPSE
jgi:Ala-tRNA(Pro) deacylase